MQIEDKLLKQRSSKAGTRNNNITFNNKNKRNVLNKKYNVTYPSFLIIINPKIGRDYDDAAIKNITQICII